MGNRSDWQRVTKRRPCPICGKPDWCLFAGDPGNPSAAICTRIESPKPIGQAGWFHRLRDDGRAWAPRERRAHVRPGPGDAFALDFAQLAAQCQAAARPEALAALAGELGLSVAGLQRLGVGWSQTHGAWSFPMRTAAGQVRGIRLRLPDGRKLSIRGGRDGLFIAEGLDAGEMLLIAEGPSDTAALLDLGLAAVGRPSCLGGRAIVVELVERLRPAAVAIVADADAPGQRGAEGLAGSLVACVASLSIIAPPLPFKDARAWSQGGATAADVLAAIAAAPVRRLSIQSRLFLSRRGRRLGPRLATIPRR